MSCREIEEKYQIKQSKTDRNTLSYHPHQIEKNNCLGRTQLASGKTLKSREILFKVVFLAECVECAINVWIIDHKYFHKLANASLTHISCV